MINLHLVIKCINVLSVSMNVNQNQWYNCILSDMGYHSATNKHLFEEIEYFVLVRFFDKSHWELFLTEMTIVQFSL